MPSRDQEADTVAHCDCPASGTIVIYLNPVPGGTELFLRAVVSGPGIEDPGTGETWIPVVRPVGGVELLDPTLVVDILPANRGAT